MIDHLPWDGDREKLLASTRRMLEVEREQAIRERKSFFQPDHVSPSAYDASLTIYREELTRVLGWPLDRPLSLGDAECRFTASDDLGRVFRVTFPVTGGHSGYGLLFLPEIAGRHPLVLALHGGNGSPELAAGMLKGNSANYREMIRGLRSRGVAVFAPQLLVWSNGQEPNFDQYQLDREFRHLGGSRAAWDLCQLRAAFEWLCRRPEIDAGRVAVTGLSYGGFYALYFGALEPRLRAVVCSCFLNDRHRYAWEDWVWTGAARKFMDSEVARMICPRPLFLEAGATDEVFAVAGFSQPAAEVRETYIRIGLPENCHSRIHPGGHEYDPDGRAEDFLCSALNVPA